MLDYNEYSRGQSYKILNEGLHSSVGSWPHPQILDWAERLVMDQHSEFVNYGRKIFIGLGPDIIVTVTFYSSLTYGG
jgi:hypothetical protein